MKNRPAIRAALAVCAVALSTAAFALPSQPVAPFEGACGYQPYVHGVIYNPPTNAYLVGSAVSLAACKAALPGMNQTLQNQGYTIVESYCRPAKYCDM